MSNFVEELFELIDAVPTLKAPVALLLIIVFGVPLMLFVGLMWLVDWMLQWTKEGVRITGNIGIDLACLALMTYALIIVENLLGFFIILGLAGVILHQFVSDLDRLSQYKRRSG